MALTLTEIWTYPIKSVGGFAAQEALVELRGLQYDRRWMLVDPAGRFMSQREIPALALLSTTIKAPYLHVYWKKDPGQSINIPLSIAESALPTIQVEVWGDRFMARVMNDDINAWFSEQLGQALRLVYMSDSSIRPADAHYAPAGQEVSFADGFPYLIIGQASLDELNRRLPNPVPMNRFRPNLVFTGGTPFEEDQWQAFQIGQQPFLGVKPCARCIIPTTDQDTGTRAAEPLKTLATFRQSGQKILFGQNVVWMGENTSLIRVGDAITHLAR